MKYYNFVRIKATESPSNDWWVLPIMFFLFGFGWILGGLAYYSVDDAESRDSYRASDNPSKPSAVEYPSGSHSQHPASHNNASGLLEGCKCHCRKPNKEGN